MRSALVKRMIVARAEHDEFFSDMRRPGRGVVIRDASLQRLPGGDDGLLGFVSGLVRKCFAGILAILHAGTGGTWGLAAQSDFMIDE